MRSRNIYNPEASQPFRLSRNKLEQFIRCPRCFYLDRRLGVDQPQIPGYTLNMAVDVLLKKEFDSFRRTQTAPPLLVRHHIRAVPFQHPLLDTWRDPTRGIAYVDPISNFELFGALDDLWVNHVGQLHVVDYKATSIQGEVTLEGVWKSSYRRQVEIYQWLLRRNGFPVSETAFFVYANASRERDAFDQQLHFSVTILQHQGDDSWVGEALQEARICLSRQRGPAPSPGCVWCQYRREALVIETGLSS